MTLLGTCVLLLAYIVTAYIKLITMIQYNVLKSGIASLVFYSRRNLTRI